ncbi:hypothetical protein CLM71_20300 [Serratia sp. MYb239]|uniref:hypothetical protein n=1 Tax=Serratia sp. MYb239 TaxID=2033438 RepID=UPI000CF683FB|nr:hypothetical protein [Serratia sp. MYb239]AVJ19309.1 hypothetical protein CLM71_20300 [Serratia sp. MYb239]
MPLFNPRAAVAHALLLGASFTAGAAYDVTAIDAASNVTIDTTGDVTLGHIASFAIDATTVTGTVHCGDRNLHNAFGRQRIFIDLPQDSATGRFKINNNLSVEVSSTVPTSNWGDGLTTVCDLNSPNDAYPASSLTNAFPIKLDFYLDRETIDGVITIPAFQLGGYSRRFDTTEPGNYKPAKYTIPINLTGGQITIPAYCNTYPNAIELDHGMLSSDNTYDKAFAELTYTCLNPVNTTITINYQENADGDLNLFHTDGSVGASSKLTISDTSSGLQGKEISTNIDTSKTFRITSELSNLSGEGTIKGTAWIIAYLD